MNSATRKLLVKLDDSPAMRKHQKKHVFIKKNGPHMGLYVKNNNRHTWVCWVNKPERNLLKRVGVKFG